MLELLVVTATLAVAAWVTGAQVHRRVTAVRALDRYAQSRGLRFVPPPARPRGSSPRVLGVQNDVAFAIDLYRLGAEVRTRVSVDVGTGRAPELSLAQHDAFRWDAPAAFLLDDDAFDGMFVITRGAAEDRESLASVAAPLLLVAAGQGVWLRSDGRRVVLSWQGVESDPTILDAACAAVVTVAGWQRSSSPYR